MGRAVDPQNYPGGFPPLMEMAFPLQPKLCPVTSAQGELGLREPRMAEVDSEDTARAWLGPRLGATTDHLHDWTSLLEQPFSGPQFPTCTRRKLNQVTPRGLFISDLQGLTPWPCCPHLPRDDHSHHRVEKMVPLADERFRAAGTSNSPDLKRGQEKVLMQLKQYTLIFSLLR